MRLPGNFSDLQSVGFPFFSNHLFCLRKRHLRPSFGTLLLCGLTLWAAPAASAAGQLAFSPSSVNFGNVALETNSTISLTLKNSGTSSLTVSKVAVSSNQFAIIGLKIPATLAPAKSLSVTIRYLPTVVGAVKGTINFSSNASNSTAAYSLSGTGIRSALGAIPGSVWISAAVGTTNSQAIQLRNSGMSSVTISSVSAPAGGISVTGLSVPVTLAPGKTVMCNVAFSPKAAGVVSGSVLMTNTSATLGIPVTGSGVASAHTVSASPASLSFGNVTIGTTASHSVTLTSAGNSSVTISAVSISGKSVIVSGLGSGVTLNPGQSVNFSVEFAPTAAGSISGSVKLTSNAANSPTTIAVSGSGVSQATHSVALKWSASASSGITGYNVYRSTVSGGPYTKIDPSPVSTPEYTDSSVQAGATYFYVVTAVNSSGQESGHSSQTEAQIP